MAKNYALNRSMQRPRYRNGVKYSGTQYDDNGDGGLGIFGMLFYIISCLVTLILTVVTYPIYAPLNELYRRSYPPKKREVPTTPIVWECQVVNCCCKQLDGCDKSRCVKANILSTIQIKGKQREYGLVANTNRTMTWRDKGSYDDGYSTSVVILKVDDEKRTVDIQYSYGLVEHDIPFCFFDSIDVINAEVVLIDEPIDLEKDSKKGKVVLWVDDVFCCLGE